MMRYHLYDQNLINFEPHDIIIGFSRRYKRVSISERARQIPSQHSNTNENHKGSHIRVQSEQKSRVQLTPKTIEIPDQNLKVQTEPNSRVQSSQNSRVQLCVCRNCDNKSYNGKLGEFCSIKCRRYHKVDGYEHKTCKCDAKNKLPKKNCLKCGKCTLLRIDNYCCKACAYNDY